MLTRHKYSTSKPAYFVTSKEKFDSIESTDEIFPKLLVLPKLTLEQKKKGIGLVLTPEVIILPRIVPPKRNAKIPLNYIRLSPRKNLPRPDVYQLTYQDQAFVRSHKKHFNTDQSSSASNQIMMRQAIIFLDTRSKKIGDEHLQRYWLEDFLLTTKFKFKPAQELEEKLWGYWYMKRKQYRFPFYRAVWKKTGNIPELVQVYKEEKRKRYPVLRDRKKMEKLLMTNLAVEFSDAESICQKVSERQALKLKQTELSIRSFYQQVSSLIGRDNLTFNIDYLEENESERVGFTDFEMKSQNGGLTQPISQQQSKKNKIFSSQTQQRQLEPKFPSKNINARAHYLIESLEDSFLSPNEDPPKELNSQMMREKDKPLNAFSKQESQNAKDRIIKRKILARYQRQMRQIDSYK